MYQTFYVYEDGNKLEIVQTRMNDIADTIFELSKAFSADSAKTLDELGIYNPDAAFELLYDNVISAAGNGKYYLNRD